MKIKHLDLKPLEKVAIVNPLPGVERLALFDVNDLMKILEENYKRSSSDQNRYAFFDMMGHVVTVRSLKLRTFFHHFSKGDCSCSSPGCSLKPAYFALEKARKSRSSHKQDSTHPQTAYLSLYGVTESGQEVEFTHDHTLARCFGGANSLINTTVMCKVCNGLKSRIESRVHNKTLSILQKFLDASSGEANSSPKFLLERIIKPKKDTTNRNLQFERFDIMPLDRVFGAINDSSQQTISWKNNQLPVKGLRLETFAKMGSPHCQDPDCLLPASYFAVEMVAGLPAGTNPKASSYFLNLYGQKGDEEVLFQHHHRINAEKDGIPSSIEVITLCKNCKEKNNTNDIDGCENILLGFGGVTSAISKKASGNSAEERLRVAASEMSKHYGKTEDEFLMWCEKEGARLRLDEGSHPVNKALTKIIRSFNLSKAGAMFFRNQQRDLFHPLFEASHVKTSHVADALAAGLVVVEKENNPNKQANHKLSPHDISLRAVEKYKNHIPLLAHQFNLSTKDFLTLCQNQSTMMKLSKPSDRVVLLAKSLGVHRPAAQVALRYMGDYLNVGPFAGTKYPSLCRPDQEDLKKNLLQNPLSFLFEGSIPGFLKSKPRFIALTHLFLLARAKELGMSEEAYKRSAKTLGETILKSMPEDKQKETLAALEKASRSVMHQGWFSCDDTEIPVHLVDLFLFAGKNGWGPFKGDEIFTENQIMKTIFSQTGSFVLPWPKSSPAEGSPAEGELTKTKMSL